MKTDDIWKCLCKEIKLGSKFEMIEGQFKNLFKGKELELVGLKATFRGTHKNDPQMGIELKNKRYLEDEDDEKEGK